MNRLFRPLLEKGDNLEQIVRSTIGVHKRRYFDYTASGLAYAPIEERLREVLETYANTHSKEAAMAEKTDRYYREARSHLKSLLELDDEFALLGCGSGATAALKRLQELLGIYIPPSTRRRYPSIVPEERPLVIIGPYEHHSNDISYREGICDTVRIGLDERGLVDLTELETVLEANRNREMIGCFCIASNVSGTITPFEAISALLRRYGAMVCFDAASSSPYMNVPSSLFDAMVYSPHKLLGGPGSCGLLAIRKRFIPTEGSPTFAGGGTVQYVSRSSHYFISDAEEREDAGTPAILQLIRAALAYQLRNELGLEWIKRRKSGLYRHLVLKMKALEEVECYGCREAENIGILSFNVRSVDPYALCADLSDCEGIQTRAGCSCAGPYGHDLLDMADDEPFENRPGWLRISVHYSHSADDIDDLVEAIKRSIGRLK